MVDNRAMRRFRPIHGVLIVAALIAAAFGSRYLGAPGDYERVTPGPDGLVKIAVADLEPKQVRFYRFLNRGNQEVKFFVGRGEDGSVQVAFDANEICYKRKRGYKAQDGWLVCRVCEKSFRLSDVNAGGGGCRPIPLAHRVDGGELVLAESDILQGWRYFR
jgi:uncharacterized membrane protein